MTDWQRDVVEPVEALVSRWTSEGNQDALAVLVPGWRGNHGLTDGWFEALGAVRAASESQAVADDDAALLRGVADRIQQRLNSR